MINLYIINHAFHYEMENLIRVFYPNAKIDKIYDVELIKPYVITSIDDRIRVQVAIGDFEEELTGKTGEDNELIMAKMLYVLLSKQTGVKQPWGLLTGIRPIKLFDNVSKETSEEKATDIFLNDYFVSEEKLALTKRVWNIEKEIISKSKKNSFSLYVSIPFCPSRCNYCSFVSSSITKTKHLVDKYIPLLCEEIRHTAKLTKEANLELKSVYIGGGTPTTLSAEQLDIIIKEIKSDFDFTNCEEFTVEAGRPDTITREKLLMLKENQIDRISINPQTLNDGVLEAIGRKHTTKQTLDAFKLARECGFTNINMDLIAGLNSDTLESFKNTIDGIIDLDPDSITVHTLALKSGSNLFMKGEELNTDYNKMTEEMVNYANLRLEENEYIPYYLYRQSKMLGNLENVGYSKINKESLYNVYVMEETHTILACGAGAVSKYRDPSSNYLERVFNFKYPYEYIDRFDEMLERKNSLIDFCDKYVNN